MIGNWLAVAQQYKNNPRVIFNVMNEPALTQVLNDDLNRRFIKEFRKAGFQNIVTMCPAFCNPYNLKYMKYNGDSRTWVQVHIYDPFSFTHQGVYDRPTPVYYTDAVKNKLAQVLGLTKAHALKYNKKIVLGEFATAVFAPAVDRNRWYTQLYSSVKSEKWHSTYHAYYEWGGWDAMPLAVALANTERCPRMRLQLHWEDDHKEKKDTFKKIEAEAKRVGRIINNIAWVDWRVSGFCENVLSASRAAVLRDLVMEYMPNEGTSYVHSPLLKMGGHVLPGVINEIHGDDNRTVSGRMDFSFDGTGAFDADVTAYKSKFSKSETFYLWYSGMNGRLNDADKTPRPQRKAWPTSRYIDSLIYLSRDRGTVKIPADWILKSHSDRHTTPPEPRAGKPVIICPDAGDVITCVTSKSLVLENLKDIFTVLMLTGVIC